MYEAVNISEKIFLFLRQHLSLYLIGHNGNYFSEINIQQNRGNRGDWKLSTQDGTRGGIKQLRINY
jgi:hypothetical protein